MIFDKIFYFLTKFSTLTPNFDLDQSFDIWQSFRFFTEKLDFWWHFRVLAKSLTLNNMCDYLLWEVNRYVRVYSQNISGMWATCSHHVAYSNTKFELYYFVLHIFKFWNMRLFYGLVISAYACKNSKIIGGTIPAPHSEPHILSLQRDRSHFCGGSLISATHGLTAAHCSMT